MRLLACFLSIVVSLSPAVAQESDIGKAVSIELNAAQSQESGCLLSFLVINGHDGPIDKAVYEVVIFTSEGQVDQLTLFDFGSLPPARPRVRQFVMPGKTCDGLGQILFNGVHSCEAAAEGTSCENGLSLTTRTGIEVLG